MTNEEAIRYFKRHIDLYCVDGISREAEEMAIKALEQQPITTTNNDEPITVIYPTTVCDDAISRDDAEECKELMTDINGDTVYAVRMSDIRRLPQVTQKSETVTEFADRCRECGKTRKGHWIWNFDKGYCKCSECGIGMGHKEFDYCPNCGAKMQESEEV